MEVVRRANPAWFLKPDAWPDPVGRRTASLPTAPRGDPQSRDAPLSRCRWSAQARLVEAQVATPSASTRTQPSVTAMAVDVDALGQHARRRRLDRVVADDRARRGEVDACRPAPRRRRRPTSSTDDVAGRDRGRRDATSIGIGMREQLDRLRYADRASPQRRGTPSTPATATSGSPWPQSAATVALTGVDRRREVDRTPCSGDVDVDRSAFDGELGALSRRGPSFAASTA